MGDLYLDVRGLTTRRLHSSGGVTFQIDFDFVDHRLIIRTDEGAVDAVDVHDGLSVAGFDEEPHATLRRLEIDVDRETPFGVPMTTPFPRDAEHAAYHRGAVERFWTPAG